MMARENSETLKGDAVDAQLCEPIQVLASLKAM